MNGPTRSYRETRPEPNPKERVGAFITLNSCRFRKRDAWSDEHRAAILRGTDEVHESAQPFSFDLATQKIISILYLLKVEFDIFLGALTAH